jgi:hypothetical protein
MGVKARRHIQVAHGYIERASLSVAMIVPANGGRAHVLAVQSGDLSARRLAA